MKLNKIVSICFWITAASNALVVIVMGIEGWFYMDGVSEIEMWRHHVQAKLSFIAFIAAMFMAKTFDE